MTKIEELEARILRLEEAVGVFKKSDKSDWLEKTAGIFADDPAFEEIARLGREYRKNYDEQPERDDKSERQ
ncbi:hypothetical protein Pla175_05210 [Pirellulimonas nuda]|uniref:Uncharacterized protein n=1 Tax=Pirellulimonas nuda TaxID=2528009 RepID=A0A518D6T1_9BACT|nr:hypothetical protein [Pirellulimonas nuda]QDU87165.1 hypothetical protein Pla175_05210 [Pirellulimonas nuda]